MSKVTVFKREGNLRNVYIVNGGISNRAYPDHMKIPCLFSLQTAEFIKVQYLIIVNILKHIFGLAFLKDPVTLVCSFSNISVHNDIVY